MTEKIKKEEGTSLDDEYRQLEKVHIRLQNNCQNVWTCYELC